MDNFSYMFRDAMERATTMVVYCIFAAFIGKALEAERRKVKTTLGHEPTPEDWQDYYNLKQEKRNTANRHQREIDHEKLRRLVFGEEEV